MEKQRWEESEKRREEKRRGEERRGEERRERVRRTKMQDAGARKGRKGVKHGAFPMICGSGGLKSRLAKAADAEPSEAR